jgi:hypothetical protein
MDMAMNKIRIPWTHVAWVILLTSFYFLISYVGQIIQSDEAVYFHKLNWNCQVDCSYMQELDDSSQKIANHTTKACDQRDPAELANGTYACRPLYDYYCDLAHKFVYDPELSHPLDLNLDQGPYNHYTHRNFFVASVFGMNIVSFLVLCLVHHLKSLGVRGFDRQKTIKRV